MSKPDPKDPALKPGKLFWLDPNDVKLDKHNARHHPEEQLEQIRASIRAFGFTGTAVTDHNLILAAGEGRTLAARAEGLDKIPVFVKRMTPSQRRALSVADNKIGDNSTWNEEKLAREIAAIIESSIDEGVLGFSSDELDALLLEVETGGTGKDPDAAPALDQASDPVTRPGDVWLLGDHRLLCGDARLADQVEALLDKERPNLMVTDPPYGVDYDTDWRNRVVRSDGSSVTARAVGGVENDDNADWRDAWLHFPGAVAYVWHGGLHSAIVQDSLTAVKFEVRAQIIWVKTRPVISRGAYHWQHEPAFYAAKEGEDDRWRFVPEHEAAMYAVADGKPADWHGGRKQSTVWFIEHLKSDTGHSTQKPVECMARPVRNNSKRGDAVYDPFVGSGTTIIAAEQWGRRCYASEIKPEYCDVAVKRWQDLTGKEARLEATGKTFGQVLAQRTKRKKVA